MSEMGQKDMKKILLSIFTMASAFSFAIASDTPSFPGGEAALKKYISDNTVYPAAAKENGVEGIVVVGFMVMPDGSLTEIKVSNFIDPDLEKEAVRVVTGMPAWIPAEKDGTPIEAPSKVDVPFILEE